MEAFKWPADVMPPKAAKVPKELFIHDDIRIDNYYWLNEKENPATIKYLEAENAYVDAMMSGMKPFEEQLFNEMKGRIKEQDESVPVFKNGYFYYVRFEEGKQYYKYCRKKQSLDTEEEILLDVDEMSRAHTYYEVTGFSVSPDNKLLAFGEDTVGRRQFTIYIKNLQTGEICKDRIFPSNGASVWANDSNTLFYTENNAVTLLSERIKKHQVGSETSADEVVFEEHDKSNYISISKTRSNQFILIHSMATMSSEIRFLNADEPHASFQVFQPRIKDVLYRIDHSGDSFLVITNWEAKNFRLMNTPLNKTGIQNWKEVIPHREDVLLHAAEPFKKFLVITERREGLIHLRIRHLNSGDEHYLDFGESTYTVHTGSNPEYNTCSLRYNYTSLTTPASVYDYDMKSRDKKLMKQQEIVGGYNPLEYTAERLYARAGDGTAIPVSLVYKNGFRKDGNGPLLLYSYGAYGISTDASFSAARLSLLNRGFAFAIAHIRGGQEMGRLWYEDGKLMKKINSFRDFISCAAHLINEGYTSAQHLYAKGGSAGGLLVGAVATMRPDLWRGVIAAVPFVDVVTTMLDESIPLTTNEFDEWGNPKEREAYEYMKSYSPYDNVGSVYPNMLVTTGLHDSQVQYFEPAKWVAKIRQLKQDDSVLLFHINMQAGHGGASGRFNYFKEIALEYAFMFALEGVGA